MQARGAIEPRSRRVRGADAVETSERPHRQQRYRDLLVDHARSKNLYMHGFFICENQAIPRWPAGSIARRAAKAMPRP